MPNNPSWSPARWAAPAGVFAGTTTRHHPEAAVTSLGANPGFNLGRNSGESAQQVNSARGRLGQLLAEIGAGPAPQLQWLQQVHGSRCIYAGGQAGTEKEKYKEKEQEPQADAFWTDQPGIGLAIQSADCVPILLASQDPSRPCIGAAHGGWRGLLAGVIQQLVLAMPVAPSQLCAWIGPCIGPRYFEVGPEVWQPVSRVSASAIGEHPTDPAKRLVDLTHLAAYQLGSCGVVSVAQSGLCTYAEPRFYSHRQATHQQGAQARTGRMASVVWVQPG